VSGVTSSLDEGEENLRLAVAVTAEVEMPINKNEIIEILRYELSFLEQDGYEHKADGDGLASPFRTSHSCLNFGDPVRRHACRECSLYQFVPEKARTDDVPCHGIELEPGVTILSLLNQGDRKRLVELLEHWLRGTIAKLENEEAPLVN
jgi:hypothetical protein